MWQHLWVTSMPYPNISTWNFSWLYAGPQCVCLFLWHRNDLCPSFSPSYEPSLQTMALKMPSPLWGLFSPLVLEISLSHYSAQKGTFTITPFNLAWTGNFSYISSFYPLEENLWIYFYSKMCLNVLWLFSSLCLIYHCKLSKSLLSYLLFPKICFYLFIFCYFSIIFTWETYIYLLQYC